MDDYAKEIEDALDKTLKDDLMPKIASDKINGGPTRPGKMTLAVEIDNLIESMQGRIRVLQALKATL